MIRLLTNEIAVRFLGGVAIGIALVLAGATDLLSVA
jgi:hypothetical protein